MEGFKPSKNEKEASDPVPEIESTLQELEVRNAQLPGSEKLPGNLSAEEEKALKDTIKGLLEK